MAAPVYNHRRWHLVRHFVLDRDGFVCQLCGPPIDPAAIPRSAWSASVDHIVEVSAGGAWRDPAHPQAVHVRCNSTKELSRRRGYLPAASGGVKLDRLFDLDCLGDSWGTVWGVEDDRERMRQGTECCALRVLPG